MVNVEHVTDAFKVILTERLRLGVVKIEFTKADGSTRSMNCTLQKETIPAEFAPKGSGRKVNPNVLPVFDVDKQSWRSFNWDSLTGVY